MVPVAEKRYSKGDARQLRVAQKADRRDQSPDTQRNHRPPIISLPAEEFRTNISQPNDISGLPSRSLSDMPLDDRLGGRMERRLPIVVVGRLAPAERAGTDGEERTYTHKISAPGGHIFSRRPWQLGDNGRG